MTFSELFEYASVWVSRTRLFLGIRLPRRRIVTGTLLVAAGGWGQQFRQRTITRGCVRTRTAGMLRQHSKLSSSDRRFLYWRRANASVTASGTAMEVRLVCGTMGVVAIGAETPAGGWKSLRLRTYSFQSRSSWEALEGLLMDSPIASLEGHRVEASSPLTIRVHESAARGGREGASKIGRAHV